MVCGPYAARRCVTVLRDAPTHPAHSPRRRDAWVAHGPYSTPWVVNSAMAVVLEISEWKGFVDPPISLACIVDGPGCAQHFNLCMRDSSWRSLHPCMHWLCGACADKWFVGEQKNTCPQCRTIVSFWSQL